MIRCWEVAEAISGVLDTLIGRADALGLGETAAQLAQAKLCLRRARHAAAGRWAELFRRDR